MTASTAAAAAALALAAAVAQAGPAEAEVVRDVGYGSDPRQRFDVHRPADARGAPVIFMVHGGAWAVGDKAAPSVIARKAARWVPRGFVVVSANYRLLLDTDPIEQARDVARALGAAQRQAASWGADPSRFVLTGHSAGAHLVAQLGAPPSLVAAGGASPWLGSVALDTAAYDVAALMQRPHARLYDAAFGRDPAYWHAASPLHAMQALGVPLLLVCSSQRRIACPESERFAARAVRSARAPRSSRRTCRTPRSTRGWATKGRTPLPSRPSSAASTSGVAEALRTR